MFRILILSGIIKTIIYWDGILLSSRTMKECNMDEDKIFHSVLLRLKFSGEMPFMNIKIFSLILCIISSLWCIE